MISNNIFQSDVPSLPFKDVNNRPSSRNRRPLRNIANMPMRNMGHHEIETNKLSTSSKNTCNFGKGLRKPELKITSERVNPHSYPPG